MMRTLLLAATVVTALAAAAPASAQYPQWYGDRYQGMIVEPGYDFSGPGGTDPVGMPNRVPYARYRIPSEALGAYGYVGSSRVPSARYGISDQYRRTHGLLPYNYGAYCNQMPKAC
jgi:hypothetical protein